MDEETRGERIVRLRGARGWTRQQLATYAKVSSNTIWRIENDITESPQANVIDSIAAALDTTPEEINGQPAESAPLSHQFEELKKLYEELPQDARDHVLGEARGLLRIVRARAQDSGRG